MFAYLGQQKRISVIRLEPNDDILLELQRAVEQQSILNGVIVGAVGAIRSYGVHVVKTTNIPPGNIFSWEDGLAYDVVDMSGYVMNGRVHAHISLAGKGHVFGGHLEEGTRVLNLAIVTIIELDGIDLTDLDRYSVPDGAPLRR